MMQLNLTRILSLVLALVLVLGLTPAAKAETLPQYPEKTAAPADSEIHMPELPEDSGEAISTDEQPAQEYLEVGGTAPTLNSALSDYATHSEREDESRNNNSLQNAYEVFPGYAVLGSVKSSDKVDIYKLTLTSQTHLSLASISNRGTMLFTLLDSKGNLMEICTYYGITDGWNLDAIMVLLPAGTYYIQIQQQSYGSEVAYASQLDYVIDFHTHTPSGTATGDIYNKVHSFTCAYCGTVEEQCNYVNYNGTYRCTFCGASPYSFVYRIAGNNRIYTSLSIANTLKQEMGVSKFSNIVVASATNFPDALTGSYLAAVKGAPILLTTEDYHADVISYISTNMSSGGTVYILGGESAVSASFANMLSQMGIRYERLAGHDRLGTNLAILYAAGVSQGQNVLVCTATGFADSLSASATGLPILLVGKTLTADQRYFLSQVAGSITIIGGTSAVSSSVESELRAYGSVSRLAGSSRYETSTMVAKRFFSDPYDAVLAYAKNYPDGLCGGPLAYVMGAPLILTDSNYSAARNYTIAYNIYSGYVLGGSGLVPDSSVRLIMDMNRTEPVLTK